MLNQPNGETFPVKVEPFGHICRDLRCDQASAKTGVGTYQCRECGSRWQVVWTKGADGLKAVIVVQDGKRSEEVHVCRTRQSKLKKRRKK